MPIYRKPVDLAHAVAQIKKKPPAPALRTRAEARHGSRDALRLLSSCRDGCTEALMTAHGFGPLKLAGLVRGGLVAAHVERVRVARDPPVPDH